MASDREIFNTNEQLELCAFHTYNALIFSFQSEKCNRTVSFSAGLETVRNLIYTTAPAAPSLLPVLPLAHMEQSHYLGVFLNALCS